MTRQAVRCSLSVCLSVCMYVCLSVCEWLLCCRKKRQNWARKSAFSKRNCRDARRWSVYLHCYSVCIYLFIYLFITLDCFCTEFVTSFNMPWTLGYYLLLWDWVAKWLATRSAYRLRSSAVPVRTHTHAYARWVSDEPVDCHWDLIFVPINTLYRNYEFMKVLTVVMSIVHKYTLFTLFFSNKKEQTRVIYGLRLRNHGNQAYHRHQIFNCLNS